jgi:hypothetical protein
MNTYTVVQYNASNYYSAVLKDFEEAICYATLKYSLRHLALIENISEDDSIETLKKSLQICQLAGIETKYHFKEIYVYDAVVHSLQRDWQMSQKGFNLLVMQFPVLNEKKARWLWALANL